MKRQSKTDKAIQYLIDNPGSSKYEAAKSVGMKPSHLYHRIKLDQAKKLGVCPTCGRSK